MLNSIYGSIAGSVVDTQFNKKYFIIKNPIKLDDAVVWTLGMADTVNHYISKEEFDIMRTHFSEKQKNWSQFRIKHARTITDKRMKKMKEQTGAVNKKIDRKLSRINNQKHPGKYSYEERRLRAKYYRTYFYFSSVAFNSTGEYGLFYFMTDYLSEGLYLCHFSKNHFDKILVRIYDAKEYP